MPYIPNTDANRREMFDSLGVRDASELFESIPDAIVLNRALDLPGPLSEVELRRHAESAATRSADLKTYTCFLGAGVYDHYIPSTVSAITGRSEFYTSYTPYQSEISQGTLQSIFEFQTLICQLTGMEVANASMYDGATALAEAALMAASITGRREWVVSKAVHPSYRETMKTYAWASGCKLVETTVSGIETDLADLESFVTENVACVAVQSPNFLGAVEELEKVERIAHKSGSLFVICFEPISLGILKPPADFNADICVGEGQPLGIVPGFGGPLLGLMACKKQFVRQMPGRLVGATVDAKGRQSYTLTLQTREQHIRRERATSNICTNEALNALAATVYLATLGRQGLHHVADLCLQKAHYAADAISRLPGFEVPFGSAFVKEFVVRCEEPVGNINERLLNRKIIGGLDLGKFYADLAGHMLVCVTEKRTREEIDALVECLAQ